MLSAGDTTLFSCYRKTTYAPSLQSLFYIYNHWKVKQTPMIEGFYLSLEKRIVPDLIAYGRSGTMTGIDLKFRRKLTYPLNGIHEFL